MNSVAVASEQCRGRNVITHVTPNAVAQNVNYLKENMFRHLSVLFNHFISEPTRLTSKQRNEDSTSLI